LKIDKQNTSVGRGIKDLRLKTLFLSLFNLEAATESDLVKGENRVWQT